MQRLEAEMNRGKAEFPSPAPGEGLWQYLHRKDLEIWSPDNFLLTPVLIFDQLEELFYRSRGSCGHIQKVLDDLADLIENRIPTGTGCCRPCAARPDRHVFSALPHPAGLPRRFPAGNRHLEGQGPVVASRTGFACCPCRASRQSRLPDRPERRSWRTAWPPASSILSPTPMRRQVTAKRLLTLNPSSSASAAISSISNAFTPMPKKIDATLVAHSAQNILEAFYQEAIRGMPENVPLFYREPSDSGQ